MNRSHTTSYSQNREDIIISAFFDDKPEGFYIDVGAIHPVHNSATKLFYNKGWRGINFGADIQRKALLDADRPEDNNLAVTLSNIDEDGKSTLNREFRLAGIKSIDFMKVNLDGHEYKVLEGNDWEKYRPELLCINTDSSTEDCEPLIRKAGYTRFFNDGLNDYYAENNSARLKNFSYKEKVVEEHPNIRYFSPNVELVTINETTYAERHKKTKEELPIKLKIRWSLIGLKEALNQGIVIAIINYKRSLLKKRLIKEMVRGEMRFKSLGRPYYSFKLLALRLGGVLLVIINKLLNHFSRQA